VYGSLYPWDFVFVSQPANPVWILLQSWQAIRSSRFPTRDFVVNIALYVPLGACGYLAFREHYSKVVAVVSTVVLSVAATITLELLQQYDPLRYSNALDVVANAIGSGAGIVFGVVFYRSLRAHGERYGLTSCPDPAAFALLLCWIAYLTFPFFPESGPTVVLEKTHAFLRSALTLGTVASRCVTWIAVGLLIRGAGFPFPRACLWMSVLLIPAQMILRTRQPVASELIGALIGCALVHMLSEGSRITLVTACASVFILVIRGVSPMDPAITNAFNWVPFASLLEAEDSQTGVVVLLHKLFTYGTTIWLVNRVGASLQTATVGIAAALMCIEVWQIHVPERTPEITDPVMALVLGYAINMLLERSKRPYVAETPQTLALK
jgi:glycopeptide antibiotics resistance protein